MAGIFSRFHFDRTCLGKVACIVLAFSTAACAGQTLEPPKPPPKQAHQLEAPKDRTRVPHVAPPPAYGNKVVRTDTQAAEGPSAVETL